MPAPALPDTAVTTTTRLTTALLVAALLASCGGGHDGAGNASTASATEAATTTNTSTSGRAKALAATTSLAVPIAQDADPVLDSLTNIPADAPTRGVWSATQAWPMNGLHAVLLPDGKVLTYGTPANNAGAQDGRTLDRWSPWLGFGAAAHTTTFDEARVNSFCSTAAFLGDGRLLVTGGNTPRGSGLFTPATGASTNDVSQLADDRWYATMLTLPDARTVIVGGMDPYNEGMADNPDAAVANGAASMTPEVYTPGVGWRSLLNAQSRAAFGPDYLRASYPRAWVAPNGQVFGISADQMWFLDVAANNGGGALRLAGKFKTVPSANAPVNVGATNSAVMFAPGRILVAGGNGSFNGDGLPASNKATVVDINGADPVLTETAAMQNARRFVNLVVLPNGQVLATGGTRNGNNGGGDAVYAAEIWNPATGAWTTGASAVQIRVYHSATLLLPNGTVLSTGGGAPGPVNNLNAEIYYPPYLFRTVNGAVQKAPRPVLTGISALRFAHGGALQLELADATAVQRLVLVANGSVTHSFNSSQRFMELVFTQNGDRLTATLPASANTAPPGFYQLVALNAAGVPSKAVVIGLGQTGATAAATLPRGQALTLNSVPVAGAAIAVGGDGLGALLTPAATPTAADRAATQFTVRDGLADAACVSLERVAQPGTYLRHAGFRLMQGAPDGSDLFKADATFCPEAGTANGSVRLRSKNYPDRLLRQRNRELWIDVEDATANFRADASFTPVLAGAATSTPLPVIGAQAAAPVVKGGTATYTPGLDAAGLSFSWDFGDGTGATAFGNTSAVQHAYAQPGAYAVTLTVRNAAGQTTTRSFVQAVYAAATANAPRASSQLLLEPRNGASARLWVANIDNDTVSVFDTATNNKLAEVAVGAAPRSLARAPGGAVWVVNRDGASISIISATTLAVTGTVALPRASQPHGLVFSPNSSAAWVALEATGQVLKLNATSGARLAAYAVGATPRHLSISGDSARLLVSRFISAPLPGEGTANVLTTVNNVPVGGEVRVFNTATMALAATVVLRHSDRTDNEIQGSGIPNYVAAAAISPDGATAWVPSKQDNVRRGALRNGQPLDFQNTVRAISSRIDMATLTELPAARVDHDNSSLASAAVYDPTGSYLFVALETSRQVAVLDAARGRTLFRLEAGLAPQSLQMLADGRTLYVHNAMARSISVIDLSPLLRNGDLRGDTLATLGTVANEKLPAVVLRGKQLFYDARDTRLSRDSYMSCAACHNDAGSDGRVWDLTGLGEGLRRTIALKGRAGTGQGFLHWSANFDEVQDFEGQIRTLAGGTGLMTDAQFNTGTRNNPLGDKKAGVSADLDALAAYLGSLNTVDPSPNRNADGSLTAAAVLGKTVFNNAACASCHGGANFTNSGDGAGLRNVGTLKVSSGKRLGTALAGIDIPTLRDVWRGGPFLHDGSAPTLAAAVQAHANNGVAAADLNNLVEYLKQIDRDEPAPLPRLANGVYRLTAQHSGKVLDVAGIDAADGALVHQWDWTSGANQRWQVTSTGLGDYTLTAQHSGKLLEPGNCNAVDGAQTRQWPARGTNVACQRWRIDALGDGSWRLTNVASGKVLDVGGASQALGGQVIQWGWLNGANQRWRIEAP